LWRTGINHAEERHQRWHELWLRLQRENPQEKPNSLLGMVALLDWQGHPRDWPRDRYPANRVDPGDFQNGYVREVARDRVKKSLQILRKNS
jgi:hypothetical protein